MVRENNSGSFCPECGEAAWPVAPRVWMEAAGPRPGFSHLDSTPLCPVMGPGGEYRPADPVPADAIP